MLLFCLSQDTVYSEGKTTFDFSFKLMTFSLLCSWSWSRKIGLIFKCLWLCFCSGFIDQCTFEKQVQVLDLICNFFSYDTVFMGTQLKFYLSIKCPLFILLTNKVTSKSFLIIYYNNNLIWYFLHWHNFWKSLFHFSLCVCVLMMMTPTVRFVGLAYYCGLNFFNFF